MKKMDYGSDYDDSMKKDKKSNGRRSMGGSLEEGVSSRKAFKDNGLRGEGDKTGIPSGRKSESVGDGMSIVQ